MRILPEALCLHYILECNQVWNFFDMPYTDRTVSIQATLYLTSPHFGLEFRPYLPDGFRNIEYFWR